MWGFNSTKFKHMTNLDKIKAKLAALKEAQNKPNTSTGGNQDLFWKPTATKTSGGQEAAGEFTVRILPNIHQPDDPFSELKFYYNFGKTWLAPCQFDRPDYCVEAYNRIIPEGSKLPKEEWMALNKLRRKLEPADRYYAAVLVRGKEEEGPKFWGFSKKIYESLLEFFADDEWGDLSDPKTGCDLRVIYTPASVNGTDYPSTKIVPSRKSSVATTDDVVLEKIKSMPDIRTLFTEPSYSELKDAVDKYLNVTPNPTDDEAITPPSAVESTTEIKAVLDKFDELFPTDDTSKDDDMPF